VLDEWVEAQLLPTMQRDAYFESTLVDILITKYDWSSISDIQKCTSAVRNALKSVVQITDVGVANHCVDRVARKVFLWIHTKLLGEDSKLNSLLKSVQKTLVITTPLVEYFLQKGVPYLAITVPDYELEDEDSAKVVVLLAGLCAALHKVPIDNLKFQKESKLGSGKLTISATYRKIVNELTVSARHPNGLYAGNVFEFGSFSANAVEIVAAMRLLNIKEEFLRKQKFPKDSNKSSVSFNKLQETFNTHFGLKGQGEQSYVIRFIKATLNSCIKLHNKGFPGGWINALRTRNKVKSDFALINLLGFTEKVPSNHKLLKVIFDTVDDEPNGKKRIVNLTQDKRSFLHQEFRTAVALTLPRLDTDLPQKHEEQMKVDPLSIKDLTIARNFCEHKRDLLVDALNESYVFRVSVDNPKSKTQPIHFELKRNRLLALSANIPLVNAKGVVFDRFGDLPAGTQKFLREKFRYPPKRRLPEQTDNQMDQSEDVEIQEDGNPVSTLKRRKTMTRGQAKESVRKSGRLAALRAQST
jgi:hypothetical protein